MEILAWGMSDIGLRRENNEDAYLISLELGIFAVADGMGGHAGGEHASRLAVSVIEEAFETAKEAPDATQPASEEIRNRVALEKVRYAIRMAGQRIFREARRTPAFKGMGTTVTLLYMVPEHPLGGPASAFIGHVGDSRAYLLREGRMSQITLDHSFVAEQVRKGLLSKEKAKHHYFRNFLTRALGVQEEVEVDTQVIPVRAGDLFLLCSDGLTTMLDDKEIEEILLQCSEEEAARTLISTAKDRGGDDNITVVLVAVRENGMAQ